jgi:hypothetical protein
VVRFKERPRGSITPDVQAWTDRSNFRGHATDGNFYAVKKWLSDHAPGHYWEGEGERGLRLVIKDPDVALAFKMRWC